MSLHTDLVFESLSQLDHTTTKAAQQEEYRENDFNIHKTEIPEHAAAAIGKPAGRYLTLFIEPLQRHENDAFSRACTTLSHLIRQLLPPLMPHAAVLIAGLGNRSVTPDAIGPFSADYVIATRHLLRYSPAAFQGWRAVSVLTTGVLGQTGIETSEYVQSVCAQIQPSALITVDALAASSLTRLMKTIQLTDTGVAPGSGVGNHREALTRTSLGIPVISLGVPTITDGSTLAQRLQQSDTGLSAPAMQELNESIWLTTHNIGQETTALARLIGYAINMALQPQLSVADIELYLS